MSSGVGGADGRRAVSPARTVLPAGLVWASPSAASSPSREMPVAAAPKASPWLLLARIKWLVKPSPHLRMTLCPRASFFISWKPRKEQGEFKTPWTPFSGKTENRSRAQTEGRGQPPAGRGPPPGAPRGAGGSPETQQPLHRLPHRAWEPGRRLDRPSGGQVTPRAAFPELSPRPAPGDPPPPSAQAHPRDVPDASFSPFHSETMRKPWSLHPEGRTPSLSAPVSASAPRGQVPAGSPAGPRLASSCQSRPLTLSGPRAFAQTGQAPGNQFPREPLNICPPPVFAPGSLPPQRPPEPLFWTPAPPYPALVAPRASSLSPDPPVGLRPSFRLFP